MKLLEWQLLFSEMDSNEFEITIVEVFHILFENCSRAHAKEFIKRNVD
jgi:hypothetical protein